MKNKTLALLLLCTILGAVWGPIFPEHMQLLHWIDSLFMSLLKMIVIPLIFFSIVSSIISIGNVKCLKIIWIYSAGYILISMSFAVLIGLFLFNFFKPGLGMSSSHLLLSNASHVQQTKEIVTIFKSLIPTDILAAAAKFEILPLVFFSVTFGIACITVGESADIVISFFEGMRNIFNKIVGWLMRLVPFGLFALLGSAITEAYTKDALMESFNGIWKFLFVFLLGLFLQVLWQTVLVKYIIRRSPKEFFLSSTNALTMAFATSSSMTTLPMSLKAAKDQNIKDEIANFVLPLSAIMNLTGTAMYEAVSALFFCQILGIELSLLSQIGVFFTSIIAGMASAGIPEGGVVAMSLVLRSVNVPTSAIALLLPFDRVLDRLRTMVNVWGDLICTAMVNHLMANKVKKTVKKSTSAHIFRADLANENVVKLK